MRDFSLPAEGGELDARPLNTNQHHAPFISHTLSSAPQHTHSLYTVMRDITFGYGIGIQIPYTDDGKGTRAATCMYVSLFLSHSLHLS